MVIGSYNFPYLGNPRPSNEYTLILGKNDILKIDQLRNVRKNGQCFDDVFVIKACGIGNPLCKIIDMCDSNTRFFEGSTDFFAKDERLILVTTAIVSGLGEVNVLGQIINRRSELFKMYKLSHLADNGTPDTQPKQSLKEATRALLADPASSVRPLSNCQANGQDNGQNKPKGMTIQEIFQGFNDLSKTHKVQSNMLDQDMLRLFGKRPDVKDTLQKRAQKVRDFSLIHLDSNLNLILDLDSNPILKSESNEFDFENQNIIFQNSEFIKNIFGNQNDLNSNELFQMNSFHFNPMFFKCPLKFEQTFERIDYDKFAKLCTELPFILKLRKSIFELLEYKLAFYQGCVDKLKDEYFRIQETSRKLTGTDPSKESFDKETVMHLSDVKRDIIFFTHILDIISELIRTGFTIEDVQRRMKNVNTLLASFIGRKNVKDLICEILYAFAQNYKTSVEGYLNFLVIGSAGVGKTYICNIINKILSTSGILLSDTFKDVSRSDLAAGYIGQSARLTKSLLLSTLEGMLYIDEVYSICPHDGDTRDYGPEIISTIVDFTGKYIGCNSISVSGYEEETMQKFMKSNRGIPRRFPHKIILNDYTAGELSDIFINYIENKMNEVIPVNCCNLIYSIINDNINLFIYQAGDMINLGDAFAREYYVTEGMNLKNMEHILYILCKSIQVMVNSR